MTKYLDELTSEQKNDLQEFVNTAYLNYSLWEGGAVAPLERCFGDVKTIEKLNAILTYFNPVDDEKVVLQLIRDYRNSPNRTLNPRYYFFKFKKQEKVDNCELEIENLSLLDTRQLLKKLRYLLDILKGPFEEEPVDEEFLPE